MKPQIFERSWWVDTTKINDDILGMALQPLIHESGHTILDFIDWHFEPQGLTAVWLLAESHLALHTWPENNQAYVQLSSCNEVLFNKFVENFEAWQKKYC